MGHGQTPVISDHARARCVEMGLSTKVAKLIWRTRDLVRPDPQGREDRVFVGSDARPDVALIVQQYGGERPVVITVLWRTEEPFLRAEAMPG